MAAMLWYFLLYSFFGFLIEVVFTRITRGKKHERKCFFLLPLCPVYGLGALLILLLPPFVRASAPLLLLFGGLCATLGEALMGAFYEGALGVRFWDYSHLPLNIKGRVCLLFSFFWGLLAVALLRWVQPTLAEYVAQIPVYLAPAAALLFAGDALYSARLLRRAGTTRALSWRGFTAPPAPPASGQ